MDNKVLVLGHWRIVRNVNGVQMVNYLGKLITLKEIMEKEGETKKSKPGKIKSSRSNAPVAPLPQVKAPRRKPGKIKPPQKLLDPARKTVLSKTIWNTTHSANEMIKVRYVPKRFASIDLDYQYKGAKEGDDTKTRLLSVLAATLKIYPLIERSSRSSSSAFHHLRVQAEYTKKAFIEFRELCAKEHETKFKTDFKTYNEQLVKSAFTFMPDVFLHAFEENLKPEQKLEYAWLILAFKLRMEFMNVTDVDNEIHSFRRNQTAIKLYDALCAGEFNIVRTIKEVSNNEITYVMGLDMFNFPKASLQIFNGSMLFYDALMLSKDAMIKHMFPNKLDYTSYTDEELCAKKVMTIPQTLGTCWFNAILMAIFYSESVRRYVLEASRSWPEKKGNKIFDNFWELLKPSYYVPNSKSTNYIDRNVETQRNNIQHITPERILYMLHKQDPIKYFINPYVAPGCRSESYLPQMMSLLFADFGVSVSYAIGNPKDSKDDLMVYELNRAVYRNRLIYPENAHVNQTYYTDQVQLPYEIDSDILVINVFESQHPRDYRDRQESDRKVGQANIDRDTGVMQIMSVDKIVGQRYKVDALILGSLHNLQVGHAIAGVTCKNKRYMYNGWKVFSDNNYWACNLMNFDWLKNACTFGVTSADCNLHIDGRTKAGKDLCFDVMKGHRMYICTRIVNEII